MCADDFEALLVVVWSCVFFFRRRSFNYSAGLERCTQSFLQQTPYSLLRGCLLPLFPHLHTYTPTYFKTKKLLAADADPHIRTGPGNVPALATALGSTTQAGDANLVATHSTVGPALVRALVAAGAKINDVSSTQGVTPFHIACLEGACAEVLQALLDAGADPCAPCAGAAFMSPLELAALKGGDPRAVRLLIEQPNSGGLNAVGVPPNRYGAVCSSS